MQNNELYIRKNHKHIYEVVINCIHEKCNSNNNITNILLLNEFYKTFSYIFNCCK